jgi:hypothetical protein
MLAGWRIIALYLFFLLSFANAAIACPEGADRNGEGYCVPRCDTCNTTTTPDIDFAGTALEQWINFSRDQLVSGAQPIPSYIREQLTGYVDPALMDMVRYRVGNPGAAGLTLQLDISAITLVDLIIFKNADEACCNPALWAHEMFHVAQYHVWGTHAFAMQYVRDYRMIENPAYAFQHDYQAWKNNQPQLTLPAGYGNFCLIGNLRQGPQPLMPLGSRCSRIAPDGIAYGVVVE